MQTVQVRGLSLRQNFSEFDDSNSEEGLPTNLEDGRVDTVAPQAHMLDPILHGYPPRAIFKAHVLLFFTFKTDF